MEFSEVDIIVWEGIIGKYGVLKHFIDEKDKVRVANGVELSQYFNNRNETF